MSICRYCQRSITLNGMFWEDNQRRIYCHAVLGQHEPGQKEPDKT